MSNKQCSPGLVLFALGMLRQDAAAGRIRAEDVSESLAVVREALRVIDGERDVDVRFAVTAACKEINAACRAALATFEARHAPRH